MVRLCLVCAVSAYLAASQTGDAYELGSPQQNCREFAEMVKSASWARQLGGTEAQLRSMFDNGPVEHMAVSLALQEGAQLDARDRSDVVTAQMNAAEIVCLRRAVDGEYLP